MSAGTLPLAVTPAYAARLSVDYPEHLDRLTTLFRPIVIIPIAIILGLISGTGQTITNTIVLNERQCGGEQGAPVGPRPARAQVAPPHSR